MDKYTRVGSVVSDAPTSDYDALLRQTTVEREDDGVVVLGGGSRPTCFDCGVGRLTWAEAGYVPWHRVCDRCGSHWDLHPVMYINWGDGWTGTDSRGVVKDVSSLDPDDRLPDGVTHTELLRIAEAEGTELNGTQRLAAASWARRALFV